MGSHTGYTRRRYRYLYLHPPHPRSFETVDESTPEVRDAGCVWFRTSVRHDCSATELGSASAANVCISGIVAALVALYYRIKLWRSGLSGDNNWAGNQASLAM